MTRPVALLVVTAALLAGCAGDTGTAVTSSSEFQACGPVENQPIQGGTHLIGDAEPPEPYSSTPGTSGWHRGGPPPTGVLDGPTDDQTIVAALEVGKVVLAFDGDAGIDPAILEHLVEESRDRLVVAEYAGDLPTPVTLLSWGRLTRCEDVDFADVTAFVLEQAGRGPDNH